MAKINQQMVTGDNQMGPSSSANGQNGSASGGAAVGTSAGAGS